MSGGIVAAPKTTKSRRTITLPAFIAEVLAAHKLEQAATQPPHAQDFVFTSMGAMTLSATRFRQRIYYHALERANKDLRERKLPELPKVKLHELRHSTISVLALQPSLAGVVVQSHAGHSNAGMTGHYTHVDDLRRNLVADVLENAHNTAVSLAVPAKAPMPKTTA